MAGCSAGSTRSISPVSSTTSRCPVRMVACPRTCHNNPSVATAAADALPTLGVNRSVANASNDNAFVLAFVQFLGGRLPSGAIPFSRAPATTHDARTAMWVQKRSCPCRSPPHRFQDNDRCKDQKEMAPQSHKLMGLTELEREGVPTLLMPD
eukprot:CAMPEP_0171770524 /NCGR_PEP_ID=MMETSP0991-20121206/53552_1 /TAXON_ID=483369 /ORGANISM="non described non described, Strain CCMP2098" /LENGTH=151 /DNA_ID=CAMNT_0012375693 /DNA_START=207 /DNA_END=663 /DNA_ORIENTATION=-